MRNDSIQDAAKLHKAAQKKQMQKRFNPAPYPARPNNQPNPVSRGEKKGTGAYSMPGTRHDIGRTIHAEVQKQVSANNEDENVGVQAAQLADQASTTALRGVERVQGVKKKTHARDAPTTTRQSITHLQQKQAIRRAYMEAKAGRNSASVYNPAVRSARKAVRDTEETSRKVIQRVFRRPKSILLGLLAVLLLCVVNSLSACAPLAQSVVNSIVIGTYPATEDDVRAAERAYAAKEKELKDELDHYEQRHPGYDEYHVTAQEIWHDPYALIAIISAYYDGEEWTMNEAAPVIEKYFNLQYILTEDVQAETRYRTEQQTKHHLVNDPETGETRLETSTETVQVPYSYTICTVTLENRNLSHMPVYSMSHHTMGMYALYMSTHGNMEGIFSGNPYATHLRDPWIYDIPQEVLDADPTFATLMEEANKYVGYPYVWGGASPETSFDCSGFVSYVFTNSGVYNTGRLGATGLYGICRKISPEEAKPGDLVFFQGTMGDDVGGITHVGIYVGDNKMIHCGSPIGYADLTESYWLKHFFAYGRVPY